MKFKSSALPKPDEGKSFKHVKKAVLPNQALTIREILKRFTRGEPMPVGQKDPQYHDGPYDLEKEKHKDLVDKEEFIESQKEIQRNAKTNEKARLDKIAADEAEKKRLKAERLAKKRAENRGSDPGAK